MIATNMCLLSFNPGTELVGVRIPDYPFLREVGVPEHYTLQCCTLHGAQYTLHTKPGTQYILHTIHNAQNTYHTKHKATHNTTN